MAIALSDISPLRYPGSKAFLVDYIDDLLKENYLDGCTFIEPYAGSSIVSLELINRGTIGKAILVERDPLIYCFWKAVFSYPYDLIERIEQLPITIETWESFQHYKDVQVDSTDQLNPNLTVELGLAGLFYNRTCFSGIIKAGPLGGKEQKSEYKIDCRFNKNSIMNKIYTLSKMNQSIQVNFGDSLVFLKENTREFNKMNTFIYADPPYYLKGKKLYRFWYEDKDHKALSKYLLSCKNPWLVSYDNHEGIRALYKKAPGKWKIYIDYTVSSSLRRKDVELLISNIPIPPESYKLALVELG